jgi:hypothetical protein
MSIIYRVCSLAGLLRYYTYVEGRVYYVTEVRAETQEARGAARIVDED